MYKQLQELDTHWNELIPAALDYNDTVGDEQMRVTIAEKLRDHYMDNKSLSMENVNKLVDVCKITTI